MFVQIIQGTVHDPAGLRRLMDRWVEELGPTAPGWLGTTAGVTDDGELVAVVRFASEQEARRNSDRAEQGAWWEEASKHFDSAPMFADCTDVQAFREGGSDDAGFVQVIQARFSDESAMRAAMAGMDEVESDGRPDLIGGLVAWHPDGGQVTQVAYFTSEEEARRGEAEPFPPHVQEAFDAWMAAASDIRYLDLHDPWLSSPAS